MIRTDAYQAGSFSEGLAWTESKIDVMDDKSYNTIVDFIDPRGMRAFRVRFENSLEDLNCVSNFSEGLATIRHSRDDTLNDRFGFIDKTGKVIIAPRFESARPFCEGLALVWINGKGGFIDKTGKIAIEPQFEQLFPFSEGLAVFSHGVELRPGTKYGYIDKSGKIVIPAQFGSARQFTQGMAVVRVGGYEIGDNGQYGYIDKNGEYAIKPIYSKAGSFRDGLALVSSDGPWHYINRESDIVWSLKP